MACERESSSATGPYALLIDLSSKATHDGLSLATVAVLCDFAMCTDVYGVADLSMDEVASQLHQSLDWVSRHVGQLIERGFLEDLGGSHDDDDGRRWLVAGMDRRDAGVS